MAAEPQCQEPTAFDARVKAIDNRLGELHKLVQLRDRSFHFCLNHGTPYARFITSVDWDEEGMAVDAAVPQLDFCVTDAGIAPVSVHKLTTTWLKVPARLRAAKTTKEQAMALHVFGFLEAGYELEAILRAYRRVR